MLFKKLLICLSQPTKIAMFIGEKIRYSIFALLVAAIIAIIPYTTKLSFKNEISSESIAQIQEDLMTLGYDYPLAVSEYQLTGEDGFLIGAYDYYLFINPNQEKCPYDTFTFPLVEFYETGVKVTFKGLEVYNKSYQDLNIRTLDFNKIMNNDYNEMFRLESLLTTIYQNNKVGWILVSTFEVFVEIVISIFVLALLLALTSKLVKQNIMFKHRFKLALDCLFIYVFICMLSLLFGYDWIQYIAVIFSSIYMVVSISRILKIEVKKEEQ